MNNIPIFNTDYEFNLLPILNRFIDGIGFASGALLVVLIIILIINMAVKSSKKKKLSEPKSDISGWLRHRSSWDQCIISGKLAGEIADHIDALEKKVASR